MALRKLYSSRGLRRSAAKYLRVDFVEQIERKKAKNGIRERRAQAPGAFDAKKCDEPGYGMSGPNDERGKTDSVIGDSGRSILVEHVVQRFGNPDGHGVRIPVHKRGDGDRGFRQAAEDGRGTPLHGLVKRHGFAPAQGKQRKKRPKKEDSHIVPRNYYKRAKNLTRYANARGKPKSNPDNRTASLQRLLDDF